MRNFIRNNTDNDSAFVHRDDYLRERALADSPEQLIDYLDLLYTGNQMSDETKQRITDAVQAIELPNQTSNRFEALLQRAMVGTLLTVTSVEFINQQ